MTLFLFPLYLSLSIGVQLSNENVFFSRHVVRDRLFCMSLFLLYAVCCVLFLLLFFHSSFVFFKHVGYCRTGYIVSISLNEWMSKQISRGYLFIYRHIHNTLRYKLNNKWLHNIDIVLDVPSWMLFIYASALNVLALFCFVWFRMVLFLLFFFLLSMLFPAIWSAYETALCISVYYTAVCCVLYCFSLISLMLLLEFAMCVVFFSLSRFLFPFTFFSSMALCTILHQANSF